MKKKILLIIILSLLFAGVAFAQESDLPDPGLTPDSPFYFLERASEAIGTFFTFGDIKKAERHVLLAAERMAEAKVMVEQEKPKLIEKTLARYEDQLVKALFRAERAETKGKDTKEVTKTITEARQKHIAVLERILEKVPEEAKPAIEHAITVSTKEGLEKAVGELKQKAVSVSGQSPESVKAKCLEAGKVPEEACEALKQSLQSFKSPRAFCTEQGSPPEICEKFPLKGFKSFKALEAWCAEMGGPPEMCTTFEARCREFGVTTADACFIAFSSISVSSAKVVPASVSSD